MQIINLTENEGSSGRGWSYRQRWLKCQRAAWLEEQAEPSDAGAFSSKALAVGMILHKLLQFHETVGQQDYALEVPSILSSAAKEAEAIFARYRGHYKPGWWGKVLGVEVPLQAGAKAAEWLPSDYTGRLDVLWDVCTPTHVKHWADAGVRMLPYGVYYGDYKTFTPPFDTEGQRHSPQFTGYWTMRGSLARKILTAKRVTQLRGTLVLGINKEEAKRPPAEGLFVPPAGDEANAVLTNQLYLAYRRRVDAISDENARMLPLCNLTQCGHSFYRCRFYLKECNLF